jgi:hypothetical protein
MAVRWSTSSLTVRKPKAGMPAEVIQAMVTLLNEDYGVTM